MGRLLPRDRPENAVELYGQAAKRLIKTSGAADTLRNAFATGKLKDKNILESFAGPFDPQWIDSLRLEWCSLMPELDQQELLYTHPGQPFLLHLEGTLLRKMGDPHGRLPNILMHGVPMGVDEYIPNVPDVWPLAGGIRNRRWNQHLFFLQKGITTHARNL